MRNKKAVYIRRYNKETEEWGNTFWANNYGNENHWVVDRVEAHKFDSVADARKCIKKYKIRNCEVEK